MKVKEFFKSTAFKSLAVLLSIVIIAGALLAVFHDLLNVTDAEKENRAIAKIYGGTATVVDSIPVITDGKEKNNEYSTGTVNKVRLMSDGNYLVNATGKGGYGGTITAWVVVECKDSKITGIGKVVYESDQGETLMSSVKTSFYDEFGKHDAEVADGALFWGGGKAAKPAADTLITNPVSGASLSAGAICNAVNTAILFIKSAVLGEAVVSSPYTHSEWVDLTDFEPVRDLPNKTVTYTLKMNSYGQSPAMTVVVKVTDNKITDYSVSGDYLQGLDSGYFNGDVDHKLLGKDFYNGKSLSDFEGYLDKDGVINGSGLTSNGLSTGASNSSSVLIRAAVFALENFETILYPEYHSEWLGEGSTHEVEGDAVTYTLKMNSYGQSPAMTVVVKVADNKITDYSVSGDYLQGLDSGYFNGDVDHQLLSKDFYNGKSLSDFEGYLDKDGVINGSGLTTNGLSTGASNSSSVLIRAAVYALANYKVFLAKGGNEA